MKAFCNCPQLDSERQKCVLDEFCLGIDCCFAWHTFLLSAENKLQFWVPEGFAHGFVVLSDVAEFLYKTTDYYAPEYERSIIWNDSDLKVDWQLEGEPLLSKKDKEGLPLKEAEVFE